MARETEHCGQKQIRWAADFWRGLMPTVCANMYTATDLCLVSSSLLQRRQYQFSKRTFLVAGLRPRKYCLPTRVAHKYVEGFPRVPECKFPKPTPVLQGDSCKLSSNSP